MDAKMKLLIAYDGSSSADTALEDLLRAGLPAQADVIVISVADVFVPRLPASAAQEAKAAMPGYPTSAVQHRLEQVSQALEQARQRAAQACERLQAAFPAWEVQSEVCGQSPAWAIVEKADRWQPDLIVLGSHNRSPLGRLFLGSVSQTVLSEARCSVRIARNRLAQAAAQGQIVIGLDGSSSAENCIAEVASRSWPAGTQAHLVAVLDAALATTLDWSEAGCADERSWIDNIMAAASAKLQARGLRASVVVREGSPKEVLVEEAERLKADCIFLGARGLRRLERVLLGSVSSAVATRAPCSVEIVRRR